MVSHTVYRYSTANVHHEPNPRDTETTRGPTDVLQQMVSPAQCTVQQMYTMNPNPRDTETTLGPTDVLQQTTSVHQEPHPQSPLWFHKKPYRYRYLLQQTTSVHQEPNPQSPSNLMKKSKVPFSTNVLDEPLFLQMTIGTLSVFSMYSMNPGPSQVTIGALFTKSKGRKRKRGQRTASDDDTPDEEEDEEEEEEEKKVEEEEEKEQEQER